MTKNGTQRPLTPAEVAKINAELARRRRERAIRDATNKKNKK